MTDVEIFERFSQEAARPGKEPLFGYATASKVIETAASHGFAAVGFDGFMLEGECIRPDMAAIADFSGIQASSWARRCQLCLAEAELFLGGLQPSKPELVFSITLLDVHEWR